jgi:cytochrome P450
MKQLGRGGDFFRVRLLDKDVICPASPDLLQELLVERNALTMKSDLSRYALYPVGGEGLLTSRGDLWRRQRKLMAPIFQVGQLARYADSMVACTERGIDTFRDGQTVDLLRETTRITMSVAGKTLFDADTFSEADEIGAAITVAVRWASNQVSFFPLPQIALRHVLEGLSPRLPAGLSGPCAALAERLHGPVLFFTEEDRRMKKAVALLDERVHRMIDDRRRSGEDRPDLLGRLLAARDDDGSRMTDKQVRDEILTLFVAGHETTATSLAWSLYLLTRHPHILAEACAEARSLGRSPRYEDIPRLGLLQRVFKETLRLYTPFPMFTRDAVADLVLGGHRFPKGTVFLISLYTVHHRADLWPDPERFDPSRFLPEAEAKRPRYAYVPFSAGPRICIGNHFALLEAPLVLATLLQRIDLEPLGGPEIQPELHGTLRPRGGIPMRVRLRKSLSS